MQNLRCGRRFYFRNPILKTFSPLHMEVVCKALKSLSVWMSWLLSFIFCRNILFTIVLITSFLTLVWELQHGLSSSFQSSLLLQRFKCSLVGSTDQTRQSMSQWTRKWSIIVVVVGRKCSRSRSQKEV